MTTVNFSTLLDINNKLILIDNSVYDNIPPTNRYWILVDAEGNRTEILSTIVNGTGDEQRIDDLELDSSLVITLAFGYVPSTGDSDDSKTKNVLYSPNLTEALYDLRKKYVDTLLDKDKEPEWEKLLKDIELIDAFNQASITLLSTDVKGSQLALDMGNDLVNKYKGEI